MTKKIELLKKIPLFKDFNDYEIAILAAITQKETYPPESIVFEEGDVGDSFYIIAEGAVRVTKMVNGGEEALDIIKEGNYFGELTLLDDAPRSATIITHETECTLLKIDKKDFNKLLFINKKLAYKFLWVFCKTLSNRLRETDEKLRSLSAMSGW